MTHKIKDILWQIISENKSVMFLYLFFSLSFPLSDVLLPQYYAKIIDDYKTIHTNIYPIAAIWFVIIVLNFVGDYLDSVFKPQLKGVIRRHLVENVLENFKQAFKEQHVGDLTSKLIKLPNTITDIFHQIRNYIIPTIMIFIFATCYFFSINKELGIMATVAIVVFIAIMYFFINNCISVAMNMDNKSDEVHEEIGDLFENMANIYASSSATSEMDRLQSHQNVLGKMYGNTITCAANFNVLFTTVYLAVFGGLIYYGYNLCKSGKIRSEQFISVVIISLYIISHLKNATSEVRDFIFNIGIVKKTQKYLDNLFEYATSHSPSHMPSYTPINIKNGDIRVENVILKYPGREQPILDGLSLHIPAHQSVAIMGRIASGKTSFIKMLLKFHPHTDGIVEIDGQDIKNVQPEILRKQIMYVPQHPIPFNRTLYENIAYGIDATYQRVHGLLYDLDLARFFHPLKLMDNVGKRGERLSGGQKQMVFLLRCFLRDCPIVILDEPTSALDKDSKNVVLQMLNHLQRSKKPTMLIITHDDEVLQLVDKTIKFANGKIAHL